jgi:PAS domain S-box-containing protein
MRRLLEFSLWQLPRWIPYACGIILVALATLLRLQSTSFFEDRGSLMFYTLPVVFVAFIGGFAPGMATAVLSVAIAKYLFIPERHTIFFSDSVNEISAINACLNWVLICIICELLREAASSYRKVAIERDSQRDNLTMILDGISDGFFAVNQNWQITHANRSVRELVGEYATVDSHLLWDFFPPEHESFKRLLIEAKELNQVLTLDVPERNGGFRWFQYRAFPEEQGMLVYIQDITERKEIQDRNERILADERHARGEAEKASRLRDEFVATVSHELRTPLVSILGWSELLQRRQTEDDYFKEGLAAIESSAKQQAKLVDELLDISRMSAGKVPMNMEIVLLSVIIQEASLGCRLAAKNKAIHLEIDTPQQDVLIQGDAGRLHQIVTNLISNAVKFSRRDGHVTVRLVKEGPSAILTVIDDGEGITEAFLPFVFDRFRQANATTTRSQGGLGLGLTIVKHLVELHGGSISVASEGLGKGTIFTIILPIAPTITERNYTKTVLDPTSQPLSNIRVMIVDDDAGTRDLVALILQESGAEVNMASDAISAMTLLEKFRPDILVSDIGMPGTDGYQFIAMVRDLPDEKWQSMPAVALTAFAREADRQKALNAGFQAHLSKPVESSVLVHTIRQLVLS